ncbi:MAG: acetyltransferase [Acidobacteriota bacterium]|nr:acetyltransferase [Acidobacteriota bacterium]
MASRFTRSCSPEYGVSLPLRLRWRAAYAGVLSGLILFGFSLPAPSQMLIKPAEPGDPVTIMPADLAIFESADERKELPCVVTQRNANLGFDLRFHAGYDVTLPLQEVSGDGELLTVVFRVSSRGEQGQSAYFVQHFNVPTVADDAKGDAVLQGEINLGEGDYHVDWLMRDRTERICSSAWDVEASLSPKDRLINLFLAPNKVAEFQPEPFLNDTDVRNAPAGSEALNVKLLVNFAPQDSLSATLQKSDTDALVSILKTIQRDPRIGRISLVAFNMSESRVVYRQETADQIDFPALGRALRTVKLGTVRIDQLNEKHSETDFLQSLIEHEVSTPSAHPDAVIFAGPKAMLNADVPQGDLRRIGDIECPVFYMNYNLNPQAVPWKDSISHAIKAFRGTEFTISRPRDLWFSTSDMVNRILRSKRSRPLTSTVSGGSR